MLRLLAVGVLALTSACATVVTGTTQPIAFNTVPAGASCQASRNGELLGGVNPTPGPVTVSRSFSDLSVRCDRAGYQPAIQTVPSSFQPWTLGNLVLGGVIGIIVDASTGAMAMYPNDVNLGMVPLPAPPPAPVVSYVPEAEPEQPIRRRRR